MSVQAQPIRRVWGLRFLGGISALVWIVTVLALDPETSGWWGQGIFYLSLGLMLSTGLRLLLRANTSGEWTPQLLRRQKRWSVLLSLWILGLLLLQQFRVLLWWDGALWLVAVLLVEFFLAQSDSSDF